MASLYCELDSQSSLQPSYEDLLRENQMLRDSMNDLKRKCAEYESRIEFFTEITKREATSQLSKIGVEERSVETSEHSDNFPGSIKRFESSTTFCSDASDKSSQSSWESTAYKNNANRCIQELCELIDRVFDIDIVNDESNSLRAAFNHVLTCDNIAKEARMKLEAHEMDTGVMFHSSPNNQGHAILQSRSVMSSRLDRAWEKAFKEFKEAELILNSKFEKYEGQVADLKKLSNKWKAFKNEKLLAISDEDFI